MSMYYLVTVECSWFVAHLFENCLKGLLIQAKENFHGGVEFFLRDFAQEKQLTQ